VSEEPTLPEPSFKESMADAMRKSRLANGVAEDAHLGTALLGSVGGIRGIIESVLPTLVFLVLHLILKDVLVSTTVPVAVAVIFIIVRALTRKPMSPAVTGAVLLALTAVLAIVTNRAENNFLPGILLNGGFLVLFLVSLALRWPAVGVFVGLLLGERVDGWRDVPAQRAAFTIATWVWVGMYAIRVAIELPLYLAANAEGLAIAKIALGVPLYALVLVATWFLIRSALPARHSQAEGAEPKVS
jgi:hypothetical protein